MLYDDYDSTYPTIIEIEQETKVTQQSNKLDFDLSLPNLT